MKNSLRPILPLLAAVAPWLALSSCGPRGEVEIDVVRQAPPEASFAKPNASSRERFGGGPEPEHEHTRPTEAAFVWEAPAGWIELAPKQFRDVNLRPGGDPELECYLTILQGDGGGLTANVNRWRNQIGLDPITDEAALALPAANLFGKPATRVELSSEGEDARALLGVILMNTGSMATVKMTGPAARVEEQRAGFDLFCRTLEATATGSSSTAKIQETPKPRNAPGALTFDLPEGWTDAGARSMRIVNLMAPGSTQCYVIRLPGEAGGLANNLNRWLGEVGQQPLESAELEALPKVELLGQECNLLEASGEYQGMGGEAQPNQTLLGVALIGSESSVFVKMVGPQADVAAEKQRFIDFLRSLKEI